MPHRLSLFRRLCALRRIYTGETDSSLLPTVTAAMSTLSTSDRMAILTTLDSGFETRLLGENMLPPVEKHVRRAVLADTADLGQQQLDAAILFALGRIAPYQWPETDVVAPMPVCRIVRPVTADTPDTTQMTLHLRPASTAPLCATLLPRVVDGTVHGLAGLRVSMHRRHVRFHLADSAPSVSVALAGTSAREWSAMLAFAHAVTGHEWPLVFDDPLTDPERAAIAAGRVPGPVAVASALLRRLRVLGDTFWLTVCAVGADGIRVEWAGGRSAAQVAAALVHPLAGLPGELFTATCGPAGSITVTVWGKAGEPTATVVLRQTPVTEPPPFTRIDAADAWAQFRRQMTVPHAQLIGGPA